jgi:DNA-binding CsgD family transcriptional regulator
MQARTNSCSQIETGLIIIKPSGDIVSLDAGASAILRHHRKRHRALTPALIGSDIRQCLQIDSDIDLADLTHVFRIGFAQFVCRTYILEPLNALTDELIGILFERNLQPRDVVHELAGEYHLTKREEELLKGLSLGLTIRDLSDKMNIKPTTLRAFLRLIKIKMGVTSRAAIMLKVWEKGRPGNPS